MILIETTCYECLAGTDFDSFAQEVLSEVKRHDKNCIMAFNGAFIRVNNKSTIERLWDEYQNQTKDAVDLLSLKQKLDL